MRSAWLLFAQCAALLSSAQPLLRVDTVRAVQPWGRRAEYSFPRLVMADRPAVASSINRHFSIMYLEVDPDTAGNDLFALVWGDTTTGTMPRLNDIQWAVRQPFPELVEIELSAEGCGAYCEGFSAYNLYDLRNGRYLPYDTLFTPKGLVAVNDTLYRSWVAHLNFYLLSMVDSLADSEIDPDYVAQVRASMDLYRECMDERPVGEPYVEDVRVIPEGMVFSIARCAPHVVRELDELDPVAFTLSLAWCMPLLRPEVRALFH